MNRTMIAALLCLTFACCGGDTATRDNGEIRRALEKQKRDAEAARRRMIEESNRINFQGKHDPIDLPGGYAPGSSSPDPVDPNPR